MSRTRNATYGDENPKDRRIRIRGVRRETPDIRRLARALIEFALAAAEAEAQAQQEAENVKKTKSSRARTADDETSETRADD